MHQDGDPVILGPRSPSGIPGGWKGDRVTTVEMYGKLLTWIGEAMQAAVATDAVQMCHVMLPDCATELCIVLAGGKTAPVLRDVVVAHGKKGAIKVD